MSSTHNGNDFEVTESFEDPRILGDDYEGIQPVLGSVTDFDIPTFVPHTSMGDVQHLPVGLAYLLHDLLLLADTRHPRCRASNAPVVPRGASSSGCSPASIVLVAISPARS